MNNNKHILFITPYPKGKAPSQRFRFEQYLDILSQKFDIEYHAFCDEKSWNALYKSTNYFYKIYSFFLAFLRRFLLVFSVRKYDFIFIHREATPIGPPIFELIIAKLLMKKIIYDFDDAIWIHNVSEKNKAVKYLKSNWKVKYICKWSYKVICGNEFLANYARQYNSKVVVIPTTTDFNYHKTLPKSSDKLAIGWTGTHSTLKHLDLIIPVIKKLEKQYNFDFIIISDKKPDYDLSSLKYVEWNKETEIEDLNNFDIGIMPLYDSDWEKGKCGFKGIQYMSLGIPTVMSPVGVNSEIIIHGKNGFLANTENEWFSILSELIQNKKLRIAIGDEGRKTIEKKYSLSANKQKYLSVFEQGNI